ncbi:PREDICTED: uncharacterized protein LOC105127267 [Populus euphratica]|uniref:Uncharacterized protein LOC105127267 n=1 Tax=Populus euphratica TaxID=75702 RepID=A0AAJ6UCD1_POPEU|nr:PREDICTED: uncharacterized protein LOC105127267 [Populus euphratica]
MATTTNPIKILSPNSRLLVTKPFCITSLSCPTLFNRATTSLHKPLLVIKCSSNSSEEIEPSNGNNLKDALSGMVDKQVEELLNRQENRVLLDGLEKASRRVEVARRELAEIERQELEAKQLRDYINQLESRASEIAECQQEILEARAMVEEAERSLSLNNDGDALESKEISRDQERLESIKAGFVSALIGTLAGFPISLTQVTSNAQLILPSTITFISCALFGLTFRYAVRRDLDNFQLKTGTAAAFGIVKGLATLAGGQPLELDPESFLSHAFNGAMYVSENLLIFTFAAISLDFCFKMGLLSPFPMKRSASRTNME